VIGETPDEKNAKNASAPCARQLYAAMQGLAIGFGATVGLSNSAAACFRIKTGWQKPGWPRYVLVSKI
jgi:hypothetical protein